MMLYTFAAFFAKTTLLLLIASSFGDYRQVSLTIRLVIVGIGISYTVILFIKAFICKPVAAYWDREIPGARCLDTGTIFIAIDVVNIVSDAIVLLLPASMTWSLNFSLAKKVRITVLLSTGGTAVALTILHLCVLTLRRYCVDRRS